jgi:hypothetical protein
MDNPPWTVRDDVNLPRLAMELATTVGSWVGVSADRRQLTLSSSANSTATPPRSSARLANASAESARRWSLIALGLLVLSLTVACGVASSDRLSADEYRARLDVLNRREAKAGALENQLLNAKSVTQIQESLKKLAALKDRSGDYVGSLRPPKGAQKENDQLAQGDHALADDIRLIIPELSKTKDPGHALATATEMSAYGPNKGELKVEQALARLKAKGYAPGG